MPFFKAPDGAQIYFDDHGLGPAILALSGLTRNSTDFDYVAPYLSSNRLIRMDYRGRGKSDWSGADTYTIPTEAGDALALLDHLGIEQAAILGTSRGGLIAMVMAAMAKGRLTGVCFVDVGPELKMTGLETIKDYIGKNPAQKTLAEAAEMRATLISGFDNVPPSRWAEEVSRHYIQTNDGLTINYDPALRDAVIANWTDPPPDLWPLFDSLSGLPLALIRGANSDLLARDVADEMSRRRPDMIFADVPDRGHVPFLDEPESLKALQAWTNQLTP